MTKLEVLKAVREKVEKLDGWCQGFSALDADGFACHATNVAATRFCLSGAIDNVTDLDYTSAGFEASWELNRAAGTSRLSEFNDFRTHAEVLDLLDRTIAKLEGGLPEG